MTSIFWSIFPKKSSIAVTNGIGKTSFLLESVKILLDARVGTEREIKRLGTFANLFNFNSIKNILTANATADPQWQSTSVLWHRVGIGKDCYLIALEWS